LLRTYHLAERGLGLSTESMMVCWIIFNCHYVYYLLI
jgi:hypothetical protein